MNTNIYKKQYVKKKGLPITLFVLFALVISEKVFAENHWEKCFVHLAWNDQKNMIAIACAVYHYSFGPQFEHAYLESCIFEASTEGLNYYKLMEISTQLQNKSNKTTLYMRNKLDRAILIFKQNAIIQSGGVIWSENFKSNLRIMIPNSEDLAVVSLTWHVGREHKNVRYLRIKGKWNVEGQYSDYFDNMVYDLEKPDKTALKSKYMDINVKVSKDDSVKVFNDSEAIIIQGAEPGANIKVYTTSGVEIKSVISNTDIVTIKLAANQLYLVHIGKSRYKVAV